ncbi:MAG: type II toxin-antitoxin system HicA family toxin [bacterium]|nr:type II toxin-antitoxin system HicA family toxin [bacterium]
MSIIPILSAREVLRRLQRAGFHIVGYKGSHAKLYNPATDKRTGVPIHPGDLGRKLITEILKQAGIKPKDFLKL